MQIRINMLTKLFSVVNQKNQHILFNKNNVPQTFSQKHLEVISDFKLKFEHHLHQ